MRTRRSSVSGLILASGCVFAAMVTSDPASAQTARVELIPWAGAYIPLRDVLPTRDTLAVGDTVVTTALADVGHTAGIALGGRVGFRVTPKLLAQASFVYAFSDLGERDAHIWAVAARAGYRVLTLGQGGTVELNLGPAIIGRGGSAYEGVSGTTDVGGVVGAALQVKAGALTWNVSVEDYLYAVKLSVPGLSEQESRFQSDLLFSIGLVIPGGGNIFRERM